MTNNLEMGSECFYIPIIACRMLKSAALSTLPRDGGKLEGDGARVATWSTEIHRWIIIGTAILLGFLYQSIHVPCPRAICTRTGWIMMQLQLYGTL